jgi:DNA-binding IclR family transcriptional regulator
MVRVDSNKSATALRALYVLEGLANAGRPLAVAEVALGIGADRSTAYRMLMTLLEAGYVIRDTTLKNYRLGYKLLSLTRSILNPNERVELINDCLRRIAERT